ncbi:Kelch repeat-containing protein [Streptomyces sp. NPDC005794]|uniref:Kelch repeat-containing protein n=1 Tax=Streptomyces sp. NPDC005794 TaxID=3364733 RepID=UPI003678CEFB
MPTAERYFLAATTGCDGKIYAVGGLAATVEDPTYSDVALTGAAEVYEPSTGAWATIPPMPTPRSGLGLATGSDGKIFAIGGGEDETTFAATDTVEIYDPQAGAWSSGPSLPSPIINGGAVTDSHGNVYAVGSDTMEIYDPKEESWTTAKAMNKERDYMVVAAGLDDKIYAMGGIEVGPDIDPVADAEVYDPDTGRWSSLPPMPTPLSEAAGATGPDGRIYVIGGQSSEPVTAIGFVYDPKRKTWSEISSLPEARDSAAAAMGSDGRIYVMGGTTGAPGDDLGAAQDVEAYMP